MEQWSAEASHVLDLACTRMMAHQRGDGAFQYTCELSPLSDAVMVIFLRLLGDEDEGLMSGLCQTLVQTQNEHGGWTAYPDQPDSVSATVLSYFALKLSGYKDTHPTQRRARAYILHHGGLHATSNLTKIILAVAGQLPWTNLPYPVIDLVRWDAKAFVNLYDFVSFTRLHIVPFLVISHLDFQFSLPQELSIKDLIVPGLGLPNFRITVVNNDAVAASRRFLLERIEPNGTLASYHLATVLAVFALMAIGHEADRLVIERAIEGLKGMVVRKGDRLIQQQFTSTVWDTSLTMQALRDEPCSKKGARQALQRGAQYLLSRQQTRVSDWKVHAPNANPGGWGFSDVNTLYPDIDDTIAALQALFPFRFAYASSWNRGIRWVVEMQNDDGGWSPFDRNCHKAWLEYLPINDMGRAMTDPSTPDITGRVLETIASAGIRQEKAVSDAVQWLIKQQLKDGSWFGRWGVTFIYGTWAAVTGLVAAGLPKTAQSLQRARAFLEDIQRADGGFGESCQSDEVNHYKPLKMSTPTQTAWGLMGLIAVTPELSPAIHRAASYLMETSSWRGGWRETYPTGSGGVAGQAYIRYHSYPYVWPTLALRRYVQSIRQQA